MFLRTAADDAVDEQVFRTTMRSFPNPVTVITALDERGRPRGLTCSAFCSVTTTPPTVLACVNRDSTTLPAIQHSQGFTVNLLRQGHQEVSDLFASRSDDKFDGISWYPGLLLGLPRLASGVLAFLDCHLEAEVHAGSHTILFGRVLAADSTPFKDGPLIHVNRRYGGWLPSPPNV
ncbi:flavin reductase family protein [Actinocorallia lasiicapitis]